MTVSGSNAAVQTKSPALQLGPDNNPLSESKARRRYDDLVVRDVGDCQPAADREFPTSRRATERPKPGGNPTSPPRTTLGRSAPKAVMPKPLRPKTSCAEFQSAAFRRPRQRRS